MKKSTTFLFCFLMFLLFQSQSKATHIVGGEMNYRYLGSNLYEVTLTCYRDCFNGIPPFDDPAIIAVYNSSGGLVSTTDAYITTQGPVSNAINSPCLNPPTNVCYQVATYVFNVALPPLPGGYTLTYQRCCRNGSVINVRDVDNTGATYFATIPDPALTTFNSNPVFINRPPTFICKDAPFTFDHSATDYEGDSLVYSLVAPFNGADRFDPIPNPPAAPPYSRIIYKNPYSLANVFGGTPLRIDAETGILQATPNSLGQFVYGISVKEYRNGVYLGETIRDFQVNVVSCPAITVASIFSPTISCGTLMANFENTSYNAATYHWDFGDTTVTNDTSSSMNPSYMYADTGDYVATLVAYSSFNPNCNDTVRGVVHIYPVFNSDFEIRNDHCSNIFDFKDRSYGIGGVANFWKWNFGDDSTSIDVYPHHIYEQPGNYSISLITSADSSCYDTLTKNITVLKKPIADFGLVLDTCTYTIHTSDSSKNALTYRWSFGDGTLDFEKSPMHSFVTYGNYTVQQIIFTDSMCIDTSEISISIPPLPLVDFTYSVGTCDSVVQFDNKSIYAQSYLWSFGDEDTSSTLDPNHTYQLAGTIPVKLEGVSEYGCEIDFMKEINFISFKNARFSANQDSCSGAVSFNDVTENAVTYDWDFGDGTQSKLKNPSHLYKTIGDHNVKLFVNNESACSDTALNKVTSEALLGELLFVPNSFTPNGDGINDIFKFSTYRPCLTYSIEIFNRWGSKIYENDDAGNMEWDGRFQNEMVPADVYVYILKNSEQQRTGIINLIR